MKLKEIDKRENITIYSRRESKIDTQQIILNQKELIDRQNQLIEQLNIALNDISEHISYIYKILKND